MALVVICGQPCSGKSIAAVTLAETLKQSETKQNVRIIDEDSFHLDRNQNYANMPAEKNLRGKLRSDVDRSVSRGDIVIVDSLNSIKGYRYELWCIARAAGIRYCVLYCDVDEAHCRQWNKERSDRGEASYEDGIFEDLVRRFEKPERRNRWDSPLFELYPSRKSIDKSSPVISEAVTYLTKTVDSKTQDVRVLQPSIATQGARVSESNSLYELDRATQEIINAIVEQQALGGAISRVTLGNELPPIEICRPIGLPELRRLRRTFVKLMGQSSLSGPPLPTDADSAKRRFVDYLNREFEDFDATGFTDKRKQPVPGNTSPTTPVFGPTGVFNPGSGASTSVISSVFSHCFSSLAILWGSDVRFGFHPCRDKTSTCICL